MLRVDRASVVRGGRIVVDDVSLEVPAGRAVAFIGPGGSGKTSLLAALAGGIPLHAGDVSIEGRSLRREPRVVGELVGYAPAVLPVWPGMRAREFLELVAPTAHASGRSRRGAIDGALALTGLCDGGEERLETLPSGLAKRLLIARALLREPQVLVLDDPFSGLDPAGREDIVRLIGDVHLAGRTVLAAVDDAAVPGCFTHLVLFRDGRIVASGVNHPAAFAGGRGWRYAVVCRGRANTAARVLGDVVEARVRDDDTVECGIVPPGLTPDRLVAMLVDAGLPVEQAGYDPPWTVQLVAR